MSIPGIFKKKKEIKNEPAASADESGISLPFNLVHHVSVSNDFYWEVSDLEELLTLEVQIGKG
jgi:hypothetical protein